MEMNLKDLDPKQIYKLMISAIVPRPIAWVSTISKEGILNAAPFSYYAGVSSSPPVVMISIGRKDTKEKKDTWKNIEETGEFVINLVTYELVDKMNITSVSFERGVNEFEKAKITPKSATMVKAPLIAESPVNIECKTYEILNIGKMGVIFGEILNIHVKDDILNNKGYIDTTKLKIVGRLGGANYCLITKENTFQLKKPDVE